MTLKRVVWLAGLCAVLAAPSAYSQNRETGGFYVGAAGAYSIAADAEDEFNRIRRGGSASIEEGAVGWSVYAGYAFTDILAAEVGYLGSADREINLRLDNATLRGDWSTSALYSAAVAYLPMPEDAVVFPFAKVGMARWNSERSYCAFWQTVAFDKGGTDLLFGAGIDVPINDTITARGEYMALLADDDAGGSRHRFQVGIGISF